MTKPDLRNVRFLLLVVQYVKISRLHYFENLHMSLKQFVEELEEIRIALVKDEKGNKARLVIEEMDTKQAKLFFQLDLGKFIAD